MSSCACAGLANLSGIEVDSLYVMLVHLVLFWKGPPPVPQNVSTARQAQMFEIPSKPLMMFGWGGKKAMRYCLGGQKLDARIEKGVIMATPTVWGGDICASGAFVYQLDRSDPLKSPVLAYFDFGSEKESVNGTFTIEWSSDGLMRLDGYDGPGYKPTGGISLDPALSEALDVFAELSRNGSVNFFGSPVSS